MASPVLSWITCFRGSQGPHHEDTQLSLWKGPCGEELRPPASSQHQLARMGHFASDPLYLFPRSAISKYTELGGFKQRKHIVS